MVLVRFPSVPRKRLPKSVRDYLARIGRKGAAKGAKRGGQKGGPARFRALTPEQRSAIARKAARARWAKRNKEDAN